ncbi:unnamed protein product, partial [Laminaria digitata]
RYKSLGTTGTLLTNKAVAPQKAVIGVSHTTAFFGDHYYCIARDSKWGHPTALSCVYSSCRSSSVGIVTIFDTEVTARTISRDELPATSGGNGWELCPVVHLLGIPLAIKKIAPCGCQICVGSQSSIVEPMKQVATRLAIEVHNGLAPPRWQGGGFNHLGTVAAARTDGQDFGFQDWAYLDSYIYGQIFDVWGMEDADRQERLPTVYSRQQYARYLAGVNEYGAY